MRDAECASERETQREGGRKRESDRKRESRHLVSWQRNAENSSCEHICRMRASDREKQHEGDERWGAGVEYHFQEI